MRHPVHDHPPRRARVQLVLAVLVATALAGCASAPRATVPPGPATRAQLLPIASTGTLQAAAANLAAASGTIASGRLELRAVPGGVRVSGVLGGLTRNGTHELAVHERGSCSAVDASSAGSVIDAGAPGAATARFVADPTGVARVDVLLPGVVLGGAARNDAVGRALVVVGHAGGRGGVRVACGVVTARP